MMKYRSLVLFSAAALLVACGGDTASDDVAPATADASPAADGSFADAPRVEGAADVRLSRARFEQWMAAIGELQRVAETTSPEVAEAIGVNADETTEAAIDRLHSHPEIVAALGRHGFTPESYVGFMMNMIYAMGAHSARSEGHPVPDSYPVNEADVKFIAENQEWVEERWRRLGEME